MLGDNICIALQAISGTTPIVGDIKDLSNLDGCCFQLITTGTVAGAWKVEVSNDYVTANIRPVTNNGPQAAATAHWTDITSQFSPAITNPAGSATSQFVQMYPFVGRSVRVTFTPASGAGNAYATYFAKGNR